MGQKWIGIVTMLSDAVLIHATSEPATWKIGQDLQAYRPGAKNWTAIGSMLATRACRYVLESSKYDMVLAGSASTGSALAHQAIFSWG